MRLKRDEECDKLDLLREEHRKVKDMLEKTNILLEGTKEQLEVSQLTC